MTFTCAVKALAVKVGKATQLPVTYDGPDKVTYSSSNLAVCTVDAKGMLMPLKAGMAVITITVPGFAPLIVTVTVTN